MSLKSTKTPDDSTLSPDVTELSGFTGSTTEFLAGDATFRTPSGSGTGITTTGTIVTTSLTKFSGTNTVTSGNLTGDISTNDSLVTTLATTGVVAGTYGSSTESAVVSVNAKGLVTTITTTAISTSGGSGITELTGAVLAGPGSGSQASVLATTGVAAGTYGSGALVPVVTVNSSGQITTISTSAISGVGGDFVKIEESTTTGTTVRFTNLGSYTNLEIRYSARSTTGTIANIFLTINDDNGNNYDRESIQALSGSVSSTNALATTTAAIGNIPGTTSPAGYGGTATIRFYDYRGTTLHKNMDSSINFRSTTGNNMLLQYFNVSWRSTAAISTILLSLSAGTFVSGSKFSLYGIT